MNISNTTIDSTFYQIVENAPDSIILVDRLGNIVYVNQYATEFLGYTKEEFLGQPIEILVPETFRKIHVKQRDDYIKNPATRKMGINKDLLAVHKSGDILPVDISLSPVKADTGETLYLAIMRDMSIRQFREARLRHAAHHDALTNLLNMEAFNMTLTEQIRKSGRDKFSAVFFIDLDDFKGVNDTYGHEIGNQLLQAFSKRLLHNLRKADIISRHGGDEFVGILTDLESPKKVESIIAKLLKILSAPYRFEKVSCTVGVSIGVSLFPNDAIDANELIDRADQAMYQAKQSGKNTFRFYQGK